MKRAAFHNSGDEICMVVVLDTIEMNVWLLIGRIYSGDGDGGVSDKEITNSVFFFLSVNLETLSEILHSG